MSESPVSSWDRIVVVFCLDGVVRSVRLKEAVELACLPCFVIGLAPDILNSVGYSICCSWVLKKAEKFRIENVSSL